MDIKITDKKYIVYKHTTPSNKVYIGITCQKPERRWGRNGEKYISKSKSGYTHFAKAIKKYGWDNIKHEILEEGLSKIDACNKEMELIKQYNSANPKFGYNSTLGGEANIPNDELKKRFSIIKKGHFTSEETREKIRIANTGKHPSEETRLKLSLAKLGKPSPRKGIKLSNETKRKISEGHKGLYLGRHHSEETKRKIALKHIGMKASLETRKKQSLAKIGCTSCMKGKHHSEETKRKISNANKGYKPTEETKKKLSKIMIEHYKRKRLQEIEE